MTDTTPNESNFTVMPFTSLYDVPIEKLYLAVTTESRVREWLNVGPWLPKSLKLDLREGGTGLFVFEESPSHATKQLELHVSQLRPNESIILDVTHKGREGQSVPAILEIDFRKIAAQSQIAIRIRMNAREAQLLSMFGFTTHVAIAMSRIELVAQSL